MRLVEWDLDLMTTFGGLHCIPEQTVRDFYDYYPNGVMPDGRLIRDWRPLLRSFWDKRIQARGRMRPQAPPPTREEAAAFARSVGLPTAFADDFYDLFYVTFHGTVMQYGDRRNRVPIRDWRKLMLSRAKKQGYMATHQEAAESAAPSPTSVPAASASFGRWLEPTLIITDDIEGAVRIQIEAMDAKGKTARVVTPDQLSADAPMDAEIIVLDADVILSLEQIIRVCMRLTEHADSTRVVSAWNPDEIRAHLPIDTSWPVIRAAVQHLEAAMRGRKKV